MRLSTAIKRCMGRLDKKGLLQSTQGSSANAHLTRYLIGQLDQDRHLLSLHTLKVFKRA